jgi:exopolysaccharide/PEP-CTERM locus tyrosine autokinase
MGKISKVLEKSGVNAIRNDGIVAKNGSDFEAFNLEREGRGIERESGAKKAQSNFAGSWDERLTEVMGFSHEAAESFRILRSRILHPDDESKIYKTIVVTSTAPKEGKSFVSANLGITLAQGVDQRSLLVDCDLRRPTLARLFGLPQQRGLADFLQNNTDLADLIQKTSIDKLTILPSGRPPVNPSELLGSARMHELVRELAERYDDRIIIFDSPPILAASETIVLSQKVDGVVLVVRQGASSRNQVKKIVELIGKEQIIGVVFNGYTRSALEAKMLGQYSYYGSYYSDSESTPRG